jgi:hypothetical protein
MRATILRNLIPINRTIGELLEVFISAHLILLTRIFFHDTACMNNTYFIHLFIHFHVNEILKVMRNIRKDAYSIYKGSFMTIYSRINEETNPLVVYCCTIELLAGSTN